MAKNSGRCPRFCAVFILGFVAIFASCGYHSTPKMINADGNDYIACSGYIHISSDGALLSGENTYSLSFAGEGDTAFVLKGVRKITLTSVPKMVPSSLPAYLPDVKTEFDRDGKPYVEGNTYTFADGKVATVRNGQWVPVMKKNTVCSDTQESRS